MLVFLFSSWLLDRNPGHQLNLASSWNTYQPVKGIAQHMMHNADIVYVKQCISIKVWGLQSCVSLKTKAWTTSGFSEITSGAKGQDTTLALQTKAIQLSVKETCWVDGFNSVIRVWLMALPLLMLMVTMVSCDIGIFDISSLNLKIVECFQSQWNMYWLPRYDTSIRVSFRGLSHVTTSYESCLLAEILHLHVKDHMTVYLLVCQWDGFNVIENLECNLNLCHL
jgi:hypothetical protein